MEASNENQTGYEGDRPVLRAIRRNRFTPFVCRWRALQEERAYAMTQLDNFSKEISERVAELCRAPWKNTDDAAPFAKDFFGDSTAS